MRKAEVKIGTKYKARDHFYPVTVTGDCVKARGVWSNSTPKYLWPCTIETPVQGTRELQISSGDLIRVWADEDEARLAITLVREKQEKEIAERLAKAGFAASCSLRFPRGGGEATGRLIFDGEASELEHIVEILERAPIRVSSM